MDVPFFNANVGACGAYDDAEWNDLTQQRFA
jgi:hypothetical protein